MVCRTGNKIIYVAILRKGTNPGVENKIKQTCKALDLYKPAEFFFVKPTVMAIIVDLYAKVLRGNYEQLILRMPGPRIIFLIPLFFCLKIKKIKLLVEVPTPITNNLREIQSKYVFPRKQLSVLLTICVYPLAFVFADRIIRYAHDSLYFGLLDRNKCVMSQNGIDTDSIKMSVAPPVVLNNKIRLIGVASIARWHGYDRIIKGIAEYSNESVQIEIVIIGSGSELKTLRTLSKRLSVENKVIFKGPLVGEDLDREFERAQVCVGSLGLHRINLASGSTLKLREYTARGMPTIFAGEDPDFVPEPDFVHVIPSDDSNVDVENMLLWYSQLIAAHGAELRGVMRQYAHNQLDYKSKCKDMLI